MKAVILAGGKGTRLRPFTVNFPKPLVPLGDVPVVEVLMRHLMQFGITDFTLTLGHLAPLIRSYFDNRPDLLQDINLNFVHENEPTGTAGSLRSVPGLDETFLVTNGDLLTDLDVRELVRFHREQQAVLTIATHARKIKIDLGVLEFDGTNQITGYREKPELTYDVSMGIYVYEPSVLNHIEPGKYLDFPTLVLKLIENGERVCAFPVDCLWLDIGRPDDYALAQELYTERCGRIDYV